MVLCVRLYIYIYIYIVEIKTKYNIFSRKIAERDVEVKAVRKQRTQRICVDSDGWFMSTKEAFIGYIFTI